MSSSNPYLPPTCTVEIRRATNLYNIVAARLLISVAVVLGLVVVFYSYIVGFEWSTPGANVLPTAWMQINVVGFSGVCGLIAAITAARFFNRGKNTLFGIFLVFLVMTAIANISVAVNRVYHLGQQQTK